MGGDIHAMLCIYNTAKYDFQEIKDEYDLLYEWFAQIYTILFFI